ncbi:21004_t:CDS:1, partial [Gigaspora rosea]
ENEVSAYSHMDQDIINYYVYNNLFRYTNKLSRKENQEMDLAATRNLFLSLLTPCLLFSLR